MPWQIDHAHSHVQFSVRHMMISKVRGRFESFSGTVEIDEQNPANSRVEVQIEAASIDTKSVDRDNHLRSPDFFNADQYPYLTFKSTRVEPIEEAHGRIIGDLTIRDVTREVGLDRPMAPMGCNFGDVDNDGYLDFYLGTGWMSYSGLVPNLMFKNIDGRRFEDVTASSGTGHLQKGHGISFADWDCDGDQRQLHGELSITARAGASRSRMSGPAR